LALVAKARAGRPDGPWAPPTVFENPNGFRLFCSILAASLTAVWRLLAKSPETSETGPRGPVSNTN
jgi:hypothetical protein